jgi:tRNA(Ile)-lysidine synthase
VAALPTALRRRVLRGWLRAGSVPDLQAVHLGAVDALLTRWRGQGRVDLPGGAGVVRTSGRLVLLPPGATGSAGAEPEPHTSRSSTRD